MRLASFETSTGAGIGVVVGDEIVDLANVAARAPRTMIELLEAGQDGREVAEAAVRSGKGRLPLTRVRLKAPVPRPNKFLALGLNYADHVQESGRDLPPVPSVFAKLSSCVNGPYEDIELPSVSNSLDYEGELGFVIGRRCRHVPHERAASVIAGYLVVNDFSVREWQWATTQWTLGKSFDTHGPIGPWIVTADELRDPHDLEIRTLVNGQTRQSVNTSQMIHNCHAIVEYLSQACTLEPGDIIATGTPAGVGARMNPRTWLSAGDVVTVEIEGIGSLRNRIVAEAPQPDPLALAAEA